MNENRVAERMSRPRLIAHVTVFVSLLACAGCAGVSTTSSETSTTSPGDENVVSGLLPIGNDIDQSFYITVDGKAGREKLLIPGLFSSEHPVSDPKGHRNVEEAAIRAQCAVPVAAATGLPEFILSTIAEYIVGAISDAAQKELAKYAAAYTAEADHPFYRGVSSTGYTPPLAVQCLRFVRYDKKAKIVRLDEVVQLQIASSGDALQVRPLRVYFARGTFVNNEPGQKVSFSSSLELDAVWYDGNVGRSKALFTYQFLRPVDFVAPVDAKADAFHYFNMKEGMISPDWSGAKRLPLAPMSATSSNTLSPTIVTYRIAGAEAGPVPAWLADVASLLKAKKDDLSKLLGDALKHSAGVGSSSN